MVKSHGDDEHIENAREVSSCANALAGDILTSNATSSIANNNICLTYKY
jgi:hypothetical protein